MALIKQTLTLLHKNLLIVLGRHGLATVIRAFLLPILITSLLSFAKFLFVPPALYGLSPTHPVRSLTDGLSIGNSAGGRSTVVLVNNGFKGGAIEQVIGDLRGQIEGQTGRDDGIRVVEMESEAGIGDVCRASLRGVTTCYGAVVFWGSPEEGDGGGIWNYTLRVDSALGLGRVNVEKDDNDAQVYILPLQHAVDAAISRAGNGEGGMIPLPAEVDQYPFTYYTQDERLELIRVLYQSSIVNFMGVVFIAGMIGIDYHLTGFMATERETGMSTLIEAMMLTKRRWHGQAARILSYHLSFSLLYLPGWLIGSLILWRGVFAHTSGAVILIYHVLSGLALASMGIFGAAFFKKSQLSGSIITIVMLLLAIVAQVLTAPGTAVVAVLSFLFTPCNFTFFITYLARWEREEWSADLTKTAPTSPWNISGIVLWVFLIIQIIVYPILGALVERYLHGTSTATRTILRGEDRGDLGPDAAVRLEGFSKTYAPGPLRRLFSFISKPRAPVMAVKELTLTAYRGQILALLGANGSGKSTTLDSIAGITKLTSGSITIDGNGGLGIAPQKNVLWDELTVEEHIKFFNKLKSPHNRATWHETRKLITSIDLEKKVKARSATLSGGQKRKLQLGMMLTGGSAVCCVDEVSSGLDPLSRRKIWDILLAERGRRTMIMTTHFLDEADLLADHIAILSKGTLRAEGSPVELKDRLGAGYRIHVHNVRYLARTPDVEGVVKKESHEETTYIAESSALAAAVIKELESDGITDYRFSGPTIEDVFLQLAEEVKAEDGIAADDQGVDMMRGGSFQITSPARGTETEKQSSSEYIKGVGGVRKPGKDAGPTLELLSGRRVGFLRQTWVLFLKRCTIFKGNWFPTIAALIIPIIACGLVTLFVRNQPALGCTPEDQSSRETAVDIFADFELHLVGGPADRFDQTTLINLFAPIYLNMLSGGGLGSGSSSNDLRRRASDITTDPASIFENLTLVSTLDEFNSYVSSHTKNVTPAGIWLGSALDGSHPTLAFKAGGAEMINAWFGQWVMDMLLTNTTIASSFVNFDRPLTPDMGDSLQLIVYVCLALCAYPAFFGLYPNLERRRNVRGLQYSNGVSPLPLWLAYTAFDFFLVVVVSSAVAVGLFAGLAHLWYHVAWLFLIFVLYGLAATLLAYNISLACKSQLSTYAFAAASQVVMFLVYLIAYLSTITYAPVNRIDGYLLVVHFVVSAVAPIGSVIRSLFLALNLFSTACDRERHELANNPGGMEQYGGPVLYLVVQSLVLFVVLVWVDGGSEGGLGEGVRRWFTSRGKRGDGGDGDEAGVSDEEVANELVRVKSSASAGGVGEKQKGDSATSPATTDGLRVVNLIKSFGKNTAVDNVTFGIQRGEVFALLGPNGAGKSTIISVVRGDLRPSVRGGDVFVEDVSVTRHLASARSHMGVCPQFDAVDQMTVREHLVFYARVRGIPDVEHNVAAVLRAVGLQAFRDRQALALSGGNKRKLSLGIALMGNPTVLLLDEPSSGLDAAAKRIMWRTLAGTVAGRSILLTTHSMEEADALAGRAGILAKRMLALGTTEQLRGRFGDRLHVHLVCKGAPRTREEDVERVREWVRGVFAPGEEGKEAERGVLDIEEKTYHGQMKFSVSVKAVLDLGVIQGQRKRNGGEAEEMSLNSSDGGATTTLASSSRTPPSASSQSAVGKLVVLLEENKSDLGIEHYSVSPTTLDQVFLTVVGRHNVREEGYEEPKTSKKRKWLPRFWSRR